MLSRIMPVVLQAVGLFGAAAGIFVLFGLGWAILAVSAAAFAIGLVLDR